MPHGKRARQIERVVGFGPLNQLVMAIRLQRLRRIGAHVIWLFTVAESSIAALTRALNERPGASGWGSYKPAGDALRRPN